MGKQFISYLRVSTKKQEYNWSIDAQRNAIAEYVSKNDGILVNEYVEVASGKNNERIELRKAVNDCKKHKASLIVYKLDRLGRKVSLISTLLDSKIDFVCVDNPHANKLTIHILSAMAEYERDCISIRTKIGLKAAKDAGVKLGINGAVLAERNKAEVMGFYELYRSRLVQWLSDNWSATRIAKHLNEIGEVGFRGGKFQSVQVIKMICGLGLAAV